MVGLAGAELGPPPRRYDYVTDGAEIYRRSFATIRAETDLSGVPESAEKLAVRMVHATGQTDLTTDLRVHVDLVPAARAALEAGAPILTDANMVASGVTRARLPAGNDVICLLRDPRVGELARRWNTTRSAAAVSLWGDELDGAVVAIGNAPTALFHLLELITRPVAHARRPIVGVPVGFIGAMESKEALLQHETGIPYLVVRGRRGGSALAAAAVNAIAMERERMTGLLFGVGLGPGDPELITLKAARLIRTADVVAYHSGPHGRSIARSIAANLLPDNVIEEALVYPVTTERSAAPRRVPGRDDRFLRRIGGATGGPLAGRPDCSGAVRR